MSSEEHNEIIPATATGTLTEEEVPQQPEETVVDQTATAIKDAESKQPDPPKDSSSKTGPTSSASTDESISAYIERQLQNLGCQDTGLVISFLPPTTSAIVSHAPESNTEKSSESEPIPQVTTGSQDKESPETEIERGNDAVSEAGFSVTKADYFQTDTSDAEELLDSSGAETVKEPPFLIALDALSSAGTETHENAKPSTSAELPSISSPKLFSPTRPLSASARTLINQHFNETNPCILPVGHATVAFNQGQVHSILRAVSTETITSSLHQMKNILEEAIRVGIRSQGTPQGSGKQRIKIFRKQSGSLGSGAEDSDVGTEGYTSGALSSEDEFVINSQRTGKDLNINPPPSPPDQSSTSIPGPSSAQQVPSPGFCSTDYEPLATLTTDQASASSPPRKRRRLPGRTGKIMKEAYFKGIQWTRTFVTGPLDPEHNKHKFYCQICKTNVSIFSKGAREIVRHFQCESHFRKDQWRYEHLRKKDKVTGRIVHEVRGKKGQLLTPLELEKEKPFFMQVPLVETGSSNPFYEDHMAGLGSIAGQEEIRLCVQISMVALFVPRCGDLNVLESLWSQIGTVTNHQSLFSPYDWGSSKLTVSIGDF